MISSKVLKYPDARCWTWTVTRYIDGNTKAVFVGQTPTKREAQEQVRKWKAVQL